MTAAAERPAWLVAWQERNGAPAPAQAAATPLPRPTPVPSPLNQHVVKPRAVPFSRKEGQGFSEPRQWPFDGGVRREAIIDHDLTPPRVIRRIGWHKCMRCRRPFFSQDVIKHRLCFECRADADRYVV